MNGYVKIEDIHAHIKKLEMLKDANPNSNEYCDAVDMRIHAIKKLLNDLQSQGF